MKMNRYTLALAAMCLLCTILVWTYGSDLEGTDFSGGRITGSVLEMKDVGEFIFIPALLLTFVYRRIAAAIVIAASLLCLPLYLYFIAPGPFRWVFRGEYSIPLHATFVWNSQAVVAIVALVMAVFFGVRNLTIQRPTPRVPQSSAVETHLGANHIK
jgi:hypothetical protein